MKRKKCSRCRKTKRVQEFSKDRSRADGLQPRCKSCAKEVKARSLSKLTPEKIRRHKDQIAEWKYSNKEYRQFYEWSRKLKLNYGMEVQDYCLIMERQNDHCAICGVDFNDYDGIIGVDHCHITGIVRGILCNSCNHGLGCFKDSRQNLNSAICYLDKYEQ